MQLPVPIALLLAALAPTLLAAPTTTPLTTGLDMQKRADEKVVACLAICLTEEHDCVGNMVC